MHLNTMFKGPPSSIRPDFSLLRQTDENKTQFPTQILDGLRVYLSFRDARIHLSKIYQDGLVPHKRKKINGIFAARFRARIASVGPKWYSNEELESRAKQPRESDAFVFQNDRHNLNMFTVI